VWDALFPRPFWDDLRRNSLEHQLDPYLVASLIRQESEFDPAAVSPANAMGLMQLLPHVGRNLAKEVKIGHFSSDQLLQPGINIQLGTRYFKQIVDHYDGQIAYALAAYNAGENRVAEWRANGTYRDTEEFVESIPFTETREYVQAILRNVVLYRLLYPEK
jgi:soluble lytic murein transglycosylase